MVKKVKKPTQKKRSIKPKVKATQKQKQKQNVKVVVQGGGQGGGVVPIPMPSYDHANTSNSYMMMNMISKIDDAVSRIGRGPTIKPPTNPTTTATPNHPEPLPRQILGDPVPQSSIYKPTRPVRAMAVRATSDAFDEENPMYPSKTGGAIDQGYVSEGAIPRRRGRPLGSKDTVARKPRGSSKKEGGSLVLG